VFLLSLDEKKRRDNEAAARAGGEHEKARADFEHDTKPLGLKARAEPTDEQRGDGEQRE